MSTSCAIQAVSERIRCGVLTSAKRVRYACIRTALAPLCSWSGKPADRPGYSLVLSAATSLLDLLPANLQMLRRQDRTHMDRLLLVIDEPWYPSLEGRVSQITQQFSDLPIETIYFTQPQYHVLKAIGWGWAYAWLAWCLGIDSCRTRYMLIHDLDLLLLRDDFLARRYELIRQHKAEYLGLQGFAFNGFTSEDGLSASNGMMLDVDHLRANFKPMDCFVRFGSYRGQRRLFDLMLYPQTRSGTSIVESWRPLEIVHPNQMICQYTSLMRSARYATPATTSLPLIPYYQYLGGDDAALDRALPDTDRGKPALTLGKRTLDLSNVTTAHLQTLAVMADEVESAMFSSTRPEVRAYFQRLAGQPCSASSTPATGDAPMTSAAA